MIIIAMGFMMIFIIIKTIMTWTFKLLPPKIPCSHSF